MAKIITAIDLGSKRIAAAMAAIRKNGTFAVLALENLISRGISGGNIVDINKAVEDISSIMGKLQKKGARKERNVFVTTKGPDVEFLVSHGMVALSRTPREITKRDVEKCLSVAGMVRIPANKAMAQKITKNFYIDDMPTNVENPIGLYGLKLESEVYIATLTLSKIQNITKCVDHAGFLLSGIYLSSVASAGGILEDREKENGVLVIDVGNSISEALIFRNNMLKSYCLVQRGANFILDKDAHVDNNRRDALLKEIFSSMPEKEGFLSAAVTGGGALLDGVIEETEKTFRVPARIGIAKNAGRDLNTQDAIIHTPTLGLIGQKAEEYKRYHAYANPFRKASHKILDIYESYF